ncbi:organic cation transporter protein-like [Panulirus ornatus]|uniref:organic cation transporter protein-like n=1 Tax=Panulirus ornatus TaxID=150431 RepID=UPI003A8A9DC3
MAHRHFDDLLTQLGTGKWNLMFFITVGYWIISLAPNSLGNTFLTPKVEYSCIPPDDAFTVTSITYNSDGTNVTSTDNCNYFAQRANDSTLHKEPCDSWEYDNSTFSNTLISQFDLVCSSEYLRTIYKSMYIFGYLIGAPLNGLLSDRFGRKTMLTLGVLVYFTVGVATCWVPVLPAILALRFIIGLMHSSIIHTGFSLAMEVCEPRHRSIVGIILGFPLALGTIGWAGLAYLLRDWHWLQLAISLPGVFLFPALWFLDESPRWLIVNGHFEQAQKVLERAARWNNVELSPNEEREHLMRTIQKESAKARQATREENGEVVNWKHKTWQCFIHVFILLRAPKMRLITLVLCVCHFMVSMSFYGMSLSTSSYSTDPFLHMALAGLMEVPGYTLMAPIVAQLGRKWPTIICFIISGTVMLAITYIPPDLHWLVMTLAVLGKVCVTATSQVLFLLSIELLPTEVRLQGLGSTSTASRIGYIVSPFINDILDPLYPSAPSLVFGLGALLAGASTLLLRETLSISLPDTITDLENPQYYHNTAGSHHISRPEEEADEEIEMAKLRA